MKTLIENGKPSFDTDGKKMYAQFPHIIYHNGKYYLYGSNKEFSDGKSGIWHWGIRIYESEDLYNWKDLGLIIPPDEADKTSPLHPNNYMDAPCIIYNEKTQKWVCWLINMGEKKAFTLTADSLFGPYTMCKSFSPCGLPIGDFDIAKTQNGKAYIYFNKPHTEIICAELTEDFTALTGNYHSILEHPESVPYARESPAYFEKDGKHYLITSGTTGFFPNPSEVAVADDLLGDFKSLGNPHLNDESRTSFHSQIRSVFKVPTKKNLYIALADRWLPRCMHIPYEVYEEWFKIWFHGASEEETKRALERLNSYDHDEDVSKAEYVLLPLIFRDGKVLIEWRDSWSLDEFE